MKTYKTIKLAMANSNGLVNLIHSLKEVKALLAESIHREVLDE